VGRDWIVVRLMPRTANSVRISSRAPGWSSARNAASEVRSAPVRAGSGPGGATTTNRVTALARSCTSGAMTARPYRSAAKAPASAPSTCPSAACRAASALDASGTHSVSGRWAASQPRHCGMACGWPPIRLMSPSAVPGLASSANAMGTCSSAMMTRLPVARSSRVAVTTPSTELSIGTTARSAVPSRTAASAAWMVGQDSGSAPGSTARSAASENVPSGPR
jgi:hypothetical protein